MSAPPLEGALIPFEAKLGSLIGGTFSTMRPCPARGQFQQRLLAFHAWQFIVACSHIPQNIVEETACGL